jgi:hypothetical protein
MSFVQDKVSMTGATIRGSYGMGHSIDPIPHNNTLTVYSPWTYTQGTRNSNSKSYLTKLH